MVNIAFDGLIFMLSLYFQNTQHYSAVVTGLAFAPSTVAVLAGNLLAGRISSAFGARMVLLTASGLMAVSPHRWQVLPPDPNL